MSLKLRKTRYSSSLVGAYREKGKGWKMGNAEHLLRPDIGIPTPIHQPASEGAFALSKEEVMEYEALTSTHESIYSQTIDSKKDNAVGATGDR